MKCKKRIALGALSALSLIALACSNADSIAGGATTNQNMPTIFMSSGKPAANAVIALYQNKSNSKVPVDQIITDANGQFNPSKLTIPADPAFYNIQIENETEAILKNSVFLSNSNRDGLKSDTLASVGSISGYVKIQKNHDVSAVEIHALGTNKFTTPDKTGKFTLKGLGRGTYDLRFSVTVEEKYQSITREMKLLAGSDTSFADTTEVPYFGIPVVSGVKASFDTLISQATISWDAVTFPTLFKNYAIYRTNDYSDWTGKAIGYTTETTFKDAFQTPSGKYWYRVQVQNTSNKEGNSFEEALIETAPSELVTTEFGATITHIGLNKVVTEVSKNDSVSLAITGSNPTRLITSISIGSKVSPLKTPVKSVVDSVRCLITKDTTILISATDNAGKMWTDSVVIKVVEDAPKFVSIDSMATLNVQDTIRVKFSDVYGKIASYRWKIGNDAEVVTTTPELPLKLTEFGVTEASVTASDDDGNSTKKSFPLLSELAWEKVGSQQTTKSNDYQSMIFSFNNSMVFLDSNKSLWTSIDGVTWENNGFSFKQYLQGTNANIEFTTLKDFIYARIHDSAGVTLFRSNDLKVWSQWGDHLDNTESYHQNSRIFFTCNQKLYMRDTVVNPSSALMESNNGLEWISTNINVSENMDIPGAMDMKSGHFTDNRKLVSYYLNTSNLSNSYTITSEGTTSNININLHGRPFADFIINEKILHITRAGDVCLVDANNAVSSKISEQPDPGIGKTTYLRFSGRLGNILYLFTFDGTVYRTK